MSAHSLDKEVESCDGEEGEEEKVDEDEDEGDEGGKEGEDDGDEGEVDRRTSEGGSSEALGMGILVHLFSPKCGLSMTLSQR